LKKHWEPRKVGDGERRTSDFQLESMKESEQNTNNEREKSLSKGRRVGKRKSRQVLLETRKKDGGTAGSLARTIMTSRKKANFGKHKDAESKKEKSQAAPSHG